MSKFKLMTEEQKEAIEWLRVQKELKINEDEEIINRAEIDELERKFCLFEIED